MSKNPSYAAMKVFKTWIKSHQQIFSKKSAPQTLIPPIHFPNYLPFINKVIFPYLPFCLSLRWVFFSLKLCVTDQSLTCSLMQMKLVVSVCRSIISSWAAVCFSNYRPLYTLPLIVVQLGRGHFFLSVWVTCLETAFISSTEQQTDEFLKNVLLFGNCIYQTKVWFASGLQEIRYHRSWTNTP